MTTLNEDIREARPARQRTSLLLAVAVTIPGLAVRLLGAHLPHPTEAALFGLAIVGAAFLLSWAAEVAQLDISAGLAIAVLALIAVLPEYAVGFVFAREGGNAVQAFGSSCHAPGASGSSACSLALANMTGANRLLIGVGWSMVVFVAWYRSRKRGKAIREVRLDRRHAVELSFLALATIYSLTLPLRSQIGLIDAFVLVAIFVAYSVRLSRAPAEEPHLVGPAAYLATFTRTRRRLAIACMFVAAAVVILLCAEQFADALVATGRQFGVSEFLLVQWLAPLASEAPELLVAGMYAWRLNTDSALGTLVSSKVNQWTLLVGTLPIVFALSFGGFHGLPIDAQVREELLLTSAQSIFGVAVLATLSISTGEALALFGLFWAQFAIGAVVPHSSHGVVLVALSIAYLVLGAGILIRDRSRLPGLLRDGLRTPYADLTSFE